MKEKINTLASYLEHLQMDGQYWFSRKKAISVLQISDAAFKLAAYRLSQKGSLKRVRNDFFIIIPPEHRAVESLPATWFIHTLMEYFKRPYYVSLLTAAALHGAAHQQPMAFQVITDKPIRPIFVGKVRIEFHYKKEIKPYFYQPIKTVTGTMNVSTPEITALDLVKYMHASGQIDNVATVLCELSEMLDIQKLAETIQNNDAEIATAQRLGYLLKTLLLPIDLSPLKETLSHYKLSHRLLVVSNQQPITEYDQEWHIAVNETVEPDEL